MNSENRIAGVKNFLHNLYGKCKRDGYLVLWTKHDHRSYFFTLNEFDKAAEKAYDLSQDTDVYYGIGIQERVPEDGGRGQADTVIFIPGLWLDVDIQGPNHVAKNLPPDKGSVLELLKSFDLQPTLMVATGGGFHIYWLFDHPMLLENEGDREHAQSLSSKFQAVFGGLAGQSGWKIDNTSDISRLLRLPGTFNHKQKSPFSVKIVQLREGNRYNPDVIAEALNNQSILETHAPTSDSEIIPEGMRNNTLASIGGVLRAKGKAYEEIYQELVSINENRCVPPLPEEEVESIVASVSEYPAGDVNEGNQNPSQKLIEFAENMNLFHTPDGESYAEISTNSHNEIFPIYSNAFRDYLSLAYFEEYGSPPGSHALKNATGVLNAKAKFNSAENEVNVRVAPHYNTIFIDLCDENREAVEISPNGWKIVSNPPVYFRRAKGMKALPTPIRGGQLKELKQFINVGDVDEWVLIVSWLLYSFRPTGPYPILILHGEQGSAKSTTAKMLRDLIDPSSSQLRTLQKSDRELMISAKNGWVVAYDNLSGVSKDVSDRLCRLSTGAGFSTRGLYTDSEEVIYNASRPIILNGIDDIANRNDLANRSLIVSLPRIPDHKRKTEDEIWKTFESARPRLLGAFLDAVCCSLKNLDNVHLKSKPRMADFTHWVVAAEPILPWKPGKFMEVYQANQKESAMISFESDIVAIKIKDFIENVKTWKGTTSELLGQLEGFVNDSEVTKDKFWPKRPNQLSNRIRRIAPSLRSAGIRVNDKKIRGIKYWSFSVDEA